MGHLRGALLMLLVVTIGWTAAKVKVKDNGQCSLTHDGCVYQLVLRDADCMQRDSPANDLESMLVSEPDREIVLETILEPDGSLKKQGKDQTKDVATKADTKEEIKKLDELERKLTKMMEGLSVRSLRHIRQIRNDLRQMTSTMDLIKQQGRSGKSKRGLSCPPEFISVGTWQSCYRFSNFNTTWHESREYCSAFGADLVSLDTLKESYILDYLIKSSPDYEAANGWWTSGNYIARNRRWMWTSKHHLKPMGFSRWAPGEPNSRSTAHCLLLYKYANYMWHDGICSELHHFICEAEIM